jgi:exodeoxyribonuclease VII small subunit
MAQLQPELSIPAPASSQGAPADAPAPVPFERALDELETIVAQMEDGTLSLDQSLAAYQRGAELVKVCETALERAKEQVRVLDGELLRPLGEVRNGERG